MLVVVVVVVVVVASGASAFQRLFRGRRPFAHPSPPCAHGSSCSSLPYHRPPLPDPPQQRRPVLGGIADSFTKLVPGDKSDNDSGGGGGEDFNSKENEKLLGDLQARVQRINDMEAGIEKLKDAELRAKTAEFRKRLASGEATTDDLLEEAFAVVREAAWRVLELRHYDVQLLGGMVLHQGRLARRCPRTSTPWRARGRSW